MIEAVEKFFQVISTYPLWFRIIFAIWASLSVLIVSGFFLIDAKSPVADLNSSAELDELDQLQRSVAKHVADKLSVPSKYKDRYGDVVSAADAGIVRLLPPGILPESAISGGGSFFSFLTRSNAYGSGSDIQLRDSQFFTGFAGANYGHFLRLGSVPLRRVLDTAGAVPPGWLEANRREAWEFFWSYDPPDKMSEIRQHQDRARGFSINGVSISENVPAIQGHSYLLRSVMVDDWDILVAFEVADALEDGSAIVVWKIVKVFDTPIAERDAP